MHVCSISYPACNADAPYCRQWPDWLLNIFPRCIINDTIFGNKNVTEHKVRVLISSTTFVWNIFRSKKNPGTHYRNVRMSSCKVPVRSCQILMQLEFYRQISEKSLNIKFHVIPSSGGPVLFHADGWTVIYGKVNSRFFCNLAKAPKIRNNPVLWLF